MNSDDLKYYGFYRGLIVDNDDPERQGRVRVKAYPMFSGKEISNEHIPWAVPAMPLFDGAGSGFGCLTIPKEDTYVWVFFEAGDIYQPVYFAEAHTATMGIPINVLTNYPQRKIWRTQSGIEILIQSEGEGGIGDYLKILHPTGAAITIHESGKISISSPEEIAVNADVLKINNDAEIENDESKELLLFDQKEGISPFMSFEGESEGGLPTDASKSINTTTSVTPPDGKGYLKIKVNGQIRWLRMFA